MKDYNVRFNSCINMYFYGVQIRERMVGADDLDHPFKVIEFLKGSKVVGEFFPDDYFKYEITEISF